jgi:serine/threonine protein kinase
MGKHMLYLQEPISKRYHLQQHLHHGMMSDVYLAYDEHLHCKVVMKLVSNDQIESRLRLQIFTWHLMHLLLRRSQLKHLILQVGRHYHNSLRLLLRIRSINTNITIRMGTILELEMKLVMVHTRTAARSRLERWKKRFRYAFCMNRDAGEREDFANKASSLLS